MTKPSGDANFRVERSQHIEAGPAAIAPLIVDFRRWRDWSPYEGLDPNLKRTYAGETSGRGASYAWEGNGKAGAGRMEILEASPSRVLIQLDFSRPFKARNKAEFTLEPDGNATRVTWAMEGKAPLLARIIGFFFNMDKFVGRDFEKGLSNLKAVAERPTI